MKKKLFFILPAVFLLFLALLFVPLRSKEKTEVGRGQKMALLYKTVRWEASLLTADGESVYEAERVYWFPRNFADLDTLWAEEQENVPQANPFIESGEVFRGRILSVYDYDDYKGLSVFGYDSNAPEFRYTFTLTVTEETRLDKDGASLCFADLKEGDTVAVGCTVDRTAYAPSYIEEVHRISLLSPQKETGYYEGELLFIGGNTEMHEVFFARRENKNQVLSEGQRSCPVFRITSESDLVSLCSALEATDFWGEEDEAEISALPTTHGKAFFKEKSLIFVFVAEGSGSNATGFRCKKTDSAFTVTVESRVPNGGGTCDMSYRILLISVDKNDVSGRTLETILVKH